MNAYHRGGYGSVAVGRYLLIEGANTASSPERISGFETAAALPPGQVGLLSAARGLLSTEQRYPELEQLAQAALNHLDAAAESDATEALTTLASDLSSFKD